VKRDIKNNLQFRLKLHTADNTGYLIAAANKESWPYKDFRTFWWKWWFSVV